MHWKMLGPDHPDVGASYNNLGVAFNDKGEYDKAIESIEAALRTHLEIGNRYSMAQSDLLLAKSFEIVGQTEKAIVHADSALTISTELENDILLAEVMVFKGILFVRQSRFEKSLELFQAAEILAKEQAILTMQIHSLSWVAWTEVLLQKEGDAQGHLAELESLLESTEPRYEDQILVLWNLSRIHDSIGDAEEAQGYLKSAYDELMHRADVYGDSPARDVLLNDTIEHQQIIEASAALQ